jgi:hypothetical protein
MLVTFHTKAHGDITMFGEIAVALLKLGGLSGNVPTAILAADIPAVLSRLGAALEEHGHAAPGLAGTAQAANIAAPTREDDAEKPVPLGQRALPLVALLRAAHAAGADVLIRPRR